MPGTFVDPDPDNSFVDLRSTDPDTVINPDDGEEYLQELALRRADRLRRNQPTLHMGDRPVNKDTLPSMIQDPRVLEACLKTLAIGVFDRQEAEKLAQLVHTLLQERQELQKDRITLKESQDRRQLRINNLMTELREKKQECLDYRQTMVALSQVHKAATDQQTSTTPETTAELPVRSPRAETPVARPHVPDQEGGVPTKPRKKLLPDPEVLTDGKKPDYDTWEIKMRAKLRHESFQYNTEELCIDYIFSRCSGRAADILAVGLEPGLYMIATSEEAFETLGAQFRDRHREERARLDFTALQLKEGGDYHAFFTDFMHLAKRARITEDRFKQEFAMKLPRVLGIQVAGLERSNAITFTE